MTERIVLVFAGGDRVPVAVAASLPADAVVVAADSGLDHAHALGRRVDVVVGDLDSVSEGGLARAEAEGTIVERHPSTKDRTDLELALERAIGLGADRIVVVGGHGGRADHFLANAFVLGSDRYAAVRIEARFGLEHVQVGRAGAEVEVGGAPGDVVTLLAVGGPAHGITTSGLRYALADESLEPGSARGVSNEMVGVRAGVHVGIGTLLVIHVGDEPPMRAE